jgi:hypothetical protein
MFQVFRIAFSIMLATINVAVASETKSLSLTTNEVANLAAALVALDGSDKIVKDGLQDKIVKAPYNLGAGLRLVVAHDLTTARGLLTEFQLAASGMQKTDGDKAKGEIEILAMQKQQVQLTTIDISELMLDQNQIPPSVLSGLSPILDESQKK